MTLGDVRKTPQRFPSTRSRQAPFGRRGSIARSFQLWSQRRQVRRRSVLVRRSVMAAMIVVTIHALVLGSVIWGGGQEERHRKPERQGAGGSAIVSAAEPVMTLILIADAGPKDNQSDETIASRGLTNPNLRITIATPDPLPAIDVSAAEDQSETTAQQEDQANAAERAALYGRYMGQIQARIERAWIRPRTAIGASLFSCRVQIVQDAQGAVRETTLQRCNGDTRWQLSLVEAIQSASPLPAPPSPDVFAEATTRTAMPPAATVIPWDGQAYNYPSSTAPPAKRFSSPWTRTMAALATELQQRCGGYELHFRRLARTGSRRRYHHLAALYLRR